MFLIHVQKVNIMHATFPKGIDGFHYDEFEDISGLSSHWADVKRDIQTLISKVCPCVPDLEPSHECPRTLGQELTDRECPVIMQCCSLVFCSE